MADLKDWYFQQPVQENEMDSAFESLERSDLNQAIDWALAAVDLDQDRGGILNGLTVTNPAGLNIDVAPGAAYDVGGRRTSLATQVTVDISKTGTTAVGAGGTPTGGVSTDPGVGNRRWVSLFVVFDRNLQDPRVDGLGAPIFFERRESFRFTVSMGLPDPTPTDRAPLEPSKSLVADFRVTDGGAVDSIDVTRRQVWFRGRDGGSVPITRAGSGFPIRGLELDNGVREAVELLLGYYNDHVRLDGSVADQHSGAQISSPTIADTPITLSAGTVESQLTALLDGLNQHVLGVTTRHADTHIDSAGIAGIPNSLTGGDVRDQLTELLGLVNTASSGSGVAYEGGDAWADGTTNPATTVELQLDKIVTDLTSPAGQGGAGKINKVAGPNWADGTTNPAATLGNFIDAMINSLISTTGGRGAAKLTSAPTATWHGGGGVSAGTLHDVLNEIISTLAADTGTTGGQRIGVEITSTWATGATLSGSPADADAALEAILIDLSDNTAVSGADRIGSEGHTPTPSSSTGLTQGSVGSQLDELDNQVAGRGALAGNNTWTGNNDFNGNVTDFNDDSGVRFTADATLTFTPGSGRLTRNSTMKAWVAFRTAGGGSGAQTIDDTWNVASIVATPGPAGYYTLNFGNAMESVFYHSTGVRIGASWLLLPINRAAGNVDLALVDTTTGLIVDPATVGNGVSMTAWAIGAH